MAPPPPTPLPGTTMKFNDARRRSSVASAISHHEAEANDRVESFVRNNIADVAGPSASPTRRTRAVDPQYSPKTIPEDAAAGPSASMTLDGALAGSDSGNGTMPAATLASLNALPNHGIETIPVQYLVFINEYFPNVEQPDSYEVDVLVPVTFRARAGAPPVEMLTEPDEPDRQALMNELHRYNVEFFQRKMRNCCWCRKPAQEFYPHFKAMYQFNLAHKEREMIAFRPMCHVIPVCGERCLDKLQEKYYSRRIYPSPVFDSCFEKIFGQYHEFQHSVNTTRTAIFEMVPYHLQMTLNWCGICRDRWYVMQEVSICETNKLNRSFKQADQKRQFQLHRRLHCRGLSTVRGRGRSRAAAGASAQTGSAQLNAGPVPRQTASGDTISGPASPSSPEVFETADSSNICEPGSSADGIAQSGTSRAQDQTQGTTLSHEVATSVTPASETPQQDGALQSTESARHRTPQGGRSANSSSSSTEVPPSPDGTLAVLVTGINPWGLGEPWIAPLPHPPQPGDGNNDDDNGDRSSPSPRTGFWRSFACWRRNRA
jgi:hypothetical protein